MESAVFMGKNYLNNCQSIANTTALTLKQMFDTSTKLVSEQDEISGLETIGWENHSWKYLSLIGDERIINLQRTKVYVFSDSVLCLGKIFENPESNEAWEQRWGWIKSSQTYRNFDRIDGESVEYFPRIQYVAAQWRSQKFALQIGTNTSKFHRKNSNYVDVQRHFLWNKGQWRRMSGKCSTRIFICKKIWKRTMVIHRSWFWEKSGIPSKKTVNKEFGTKLQKGCCWNSLIADVHFSVLRLHCPEVNSEAKDMLNCRYILQPIRKRLRQFFASLFLQTSSVFTEQSQRYVKSMNPFTKERGDPLWWGNRVLHSCQVRSRQKYFWIVMTQRIKIFYCNNMKNELRSCHNKTDWVNSVWMQDLWVLLRMDSISWRKTLEISRKRSKILHADRRHKQNQKEENLLALNRSNWKKELDRYWTKEIFSLRIRGIVESNLSSSSFTTSASRRRRSDSFLENEGKSSESIPTIYLLVWWTIEIMFRSRRRSKKEISVLYRWFRNNCLFPSSSRTFRTQSYWSFITR